MVTYWGGVAMFLRQKRSGSRVYLQIVENRWEGGGVKQRVIATLGRLDELQAAGGVEALVRSAVRFCEGLLVIEAQARGEAPVVACRRIGPGLVLERLWQEVGFQAVLTDLLVERHFELPVERAVFASTARSGLGPGGRALADGLCALRHRGIGASSSLSRYGLARGGIA